MVLRQLVAVNNIQIRIPIDIVNIVEEQPDRVIIYDTVSIRYDDADRTG